VEELNEQAKNAGVTINLYSHGGYYVELSERDFVLQRLDFFPIRPLVCIFPQDPARVISVDLLKKLVSEVVAGIGKRGFMSFFLMLDLDDILAVEHMRPEALIEVVTKNGLVMVLYEVQVETEA
jgi:hypothetical protein